MMPDQFSRQPEGECSSRDELLRKCQEERPGENSPLLTPTPKEEPLCAWPIAGP